MPDNEALLVEIEAAKVRHAWAKAQLEHPGHLPSLVKYAAESEDELRALMALVKPRHPIKPIAK
jgi:hypothetical protein